MNQEPAGFRFPDGAEVSVWGLWQCPYVGRVVDCLGATLLLSRRTLTFVVPVGQNEADRVGVQISDAEHTTIIELANVFGSGVTLIETRDGPAVEIRSGKCLVDLNLKFRAAPSSVVPTSSPKANEIMISWLTDGRVARPGSDPTVAREKWLKSVQGQVNKARRARIGIPVCIQLGGGALKYRQRIVTYLGDRLLLAHYLDVVNRPGFSGDSGL